jgi:hypothetical protein
MNAAFYQLTALLLLCVSVLLVHALAPAAVLSHLLVVLLLLLLLLLL